MKSYDEYKLEILQQKRQTLRSRIYLNKKNVNVLAKKQAELKRLRKPMDEDIKQLEQAIKDAE